MSPLPHSHLSPVVGITFFIYFTVFVEGVKKIAIKLRCIWTYQLFGIFLVVNFSSLFLNAIISSEVPWHAVH